MKLLPVNATDDEILAACRAWVDLVAGGRFAEAVESLYVPDWYVEEQRWTPESLQTYVRNYGSWDAWPDGKTWRITSISTAQFPADRPDVKPRADLVRHDYDRRAGIVELDVPLNGVWSDLMLHFKFEPLEDETGLSLYDMYVP